MRFGIHIPLKGGLEKNAKRAVGLGCEAIQMFAGNPTAWKPAATDEEIIKKRGDYLKELKIHPVVIHMPYLANLASPQADYYKKSLVLLKDNMKKAAVYGASYVVVHMGNHRGEGEEKGLNILLATLEKEIESFPPGVSLLLENTPGGGRELGGDLNHFRAVFEALPGKDIPLGICWDTAHAWVAGFDLSSRDKTLYFLERFEKIVGLDRIKAMHVNDTLSPLASHRDRHAHIGEGHLKEGFPVLLQHDWPSSFPFILETPEIGTEMDEVNLAALKKAAAVGKVI